MPEDKKVLDEIKELREELAATRGSHEALVRQLEGSRPRSFTEAAHAARQLLRDGYAQSDAEREAAAAGEGDDDE